MIDQDKIIELFEEKYQKLLGQSYEDWHENSPKTESEAYSSLQEIDSELKATQDAYLEASGEQKSQLEEYRERLRNEYQLLEEIFGLESKDADW